MPRNNDLPQHILDQSGQDVVYLFPRDNPKIFIHGESPAPEMYPSLPWTLQSLKDDLHAKRS